ncbi:putative MFS transporter [Rhodococcus sp. 27YEA15]|uniref:MFS transporter n=1 Tax=Rhodococcus sp. 27YEA15 TaxID=3156259 RepID=UPI003C7B6FA2
MTTDTQASGVGRPAESNGKRDLLSALDEAPVTSRYISTSGFVLITGAAEFFDLFIINFVIVVLAKDWQLTFGHTAAILISSGVGSMVGAFCWGYLGDRFGRKKPLVAGILLFSASALAMGLMPEGAWQLLIVLRLVTGFAAPSLPVLGTPLVLEYTPTRHRTFIGAYAVSGLVSIGALMASALSAVLLSTIGWRGLFMLGAVPAILAIWAIFGVRESPRWLLTNGHDEAAKRAVAWVTKTDVAHLTVSDSTRAEIAAGKSSQTDVGAFKTLFKLEGTFPIAVISMLGLSIAIYGVQAWGPMILTLIGDITPAKAASIFIWVSVAGLVGRLAFSLVAKSLGRRRCLQISCFTGAAGLLAGAFSPMLPGNWTIIIFFASLVLTGLLIDGGLVNHAPYVAEIFPANMRARGMGLREGANGAGKIIGPAIFAVFAGSSDFVKPAATESAITPAFILLAAAVATAGLVFTFTKLEPNGRRLEEVRDLDEVRETSG